MIGAATHHGGAYSSSSGEYETWEYDASTGVKTYTSGSRAGQTEQVTEPTYGGGGNRATSDNSGNQMPGAGIPDSGNVAATEDNATNWLLVTVVCGVAGYFMFGGRKSKKRKR